MSQNEFLPKKSFSEKNCFEQQVKKTRAMYGGVI